MTPTTPPAAIAGLRVKLFADGADLAGMTALRALPFIAGFTTNPTLMRKAGVRDYARFGREAVERIPDRPISFEVLSDEFDEMAREAHEIASWGPLVYVKIPVTNTRSEPSYGLIHRLSHDGIRINVTAVLTLDQVERAVDALGGDGAPAYVSMFAGRIADTGRDPAPDIREARNILGRAPQAELIWASPREVLNIFQADAAGCHIITLTDDILRKLDLLGRDLADFSLATVRMFRDDAIAAGLAFAREVESR